MPLPALDPRALLRYGVLGLVGLLLAVGVRSCPTSRDDDPARDILAVALARRMHADALALDSARVALSRASARSQTMIARYSGIRDTALQHLTDTVLVKQYVERADSVVRSCTELVESCSRFRVRTDSSIADLTLDRDRWKRATESLQPSRWDGVKTWAIRIGIGVGAFKLGQSVR